MINRGKSTGVSLKLVHAATARGTRKNSADCKILRALKRTQFFTQKKHSFTYSVSCFMYRIRSKKCFHATKSTSSSSACIILNLNIAVVCLINKRALQKIWKKVTMFRGRYILTYELEDALHLLKVFDPTPKLFNIQL